MQKQEDVQCYIINTKMKCPKCKKKMQVDLLDRRYVCFNSRCKNIIHWVGSNNNKEVIQCH